jgi:hypothetical protein
MRWAEFASAEGELATIARERLEAQHLCLVGTIRRDGWPRISPVEPYVVGPDLLLGMMGDSKKAIDLRHDPRLVIHSIVTRWEGDEGDVKLYGFAQEVVDVTNLLAFRHAVEVAHRWALSDAPYHPYHVFAIDIERAAHVQFNADRYVVLVWDQVAGKRRRTFPSAMPS